MTENHASSERRSLPADMAVEEWLAPDRWPLRSFTLPAEAAKGAILFLGGRGDFFEKYLEAFGHWRREGWTVSGFDWRGQGGSGRTYSGPGSHIGDFSTYVTDLEAYWSQWRPEAAGPRVVIAHSMGAHVVLKALVDRSITPAGIVLLSPMIGIRAGPLGGAALRRLARTIGAAAPFRERLIWRGPASPAPGRVTSCPERQADKLWWKSAHPEIGRGGPTWGWLAAATASIAKVNDKLRSQPVAVPGLILAARDDIVVDARAIDRTAQLLPTFEYEVIEDAGHELLRERDGPREEALARVDAFLGRLTACS